MAFVKRATQNNIKLTGFWNRQIGEVLTGKLLKYVPNDKDKKNPRPFFIVETVKPGKGEKAFLNIEGQKESVAVKGGEYVGVAANWSLSQQLDMSKDTGKLIRITPTELIDNPNGGPQMTIVTVEVDEEEPAPF
jgi:hypothetical protein